MRARQRKEEGEIYTDLVASVDSVIDRTRVQFAVRPAPAASVVRCTRIKFVVRELSKSRLPTCTQNTCARCRICTPVTYTLFPVFFLRARTPVAGEKASLVGLQRARP